jgi:glucokinase
MLLAGDIGGTKTVLAIYSSQTGPRVPLFQAEFNSAGYPGLENIVRDFLARTDLRVECACIGVAGPVIAGCAKITNLPWVADETKLAMEFGFKWVRLINDLEAIAHAIPILHAADTHTLNTGDALPVGAIAVIAPGTGLGESFLTWDGARYVAHSSEGGHSDFAPADEPQIGLLRYMQKIYDHISYEHVCSGIGIPHIYNFLRDSGYAPETPNMAGLLSATTDPTPLICQAALHPTRPDRLCVSTVETFISILGAEAGNLALKVLATGGVYIGGGIPLHILPALKKSSFMRSFMRKGRFADMLSRIPVRILVVKAGLIGAANCGLELMLKRRASKTSEPIPPEESQEMAA